MSEALAAHLTAILSDEATPAALYNSIVDGILEVTNDVDIFAPELLPIALKLASEKGEQDTASDQSTPEPAAPLYLVQDELINLCVDKVLMTPDDGERAEYLIMLLIAAKHTLKESTTLETDHLLFYAALSAFRHSSPFTASFMDFYQRLESKLSKLER